MTGTYNSYDGGGYVAVLGYDEETAKGVLTETLGKGWIDRRTKAVILEFAVFNVNTNLLTIATYFYEVKATGVAYTTAKVDTLELYSRFRCCHVLPDLPIHFHGHGGLQLDHDVGPSLPTACCVFHINLEYGRFLYGRLLRTVSGVLHD